MKLKIYLSTIVLSAFLLSGCYTKFSMNNEGRYYSQYEKNKNKYEYETETQVDENNFTEEEEIEIENNKSSNEIEVNNYYYNDDYDWWPRQRTYSRFYSPSFAFSYSYNSPFYSWNSSLYWDSYCYDYFGWNNHYSYWWNCYPTYSSYYYDPFYYNNYYYDRWLWNYGGGYSSNTNKNYRNVRTIGKSRDDVSGSRGEREIGTRENSIRGGGSTFSGTSVKSGQVIKNSNDGNYHTTRRRGVKTTRSSFLGDRSNTLGSKQNKSKNYLKKDSENKSIDTETSKPTPVVNGRESQNSSTNTNQNKSREIGKSRDNNNNNSGNGNSQRQNNNSTPKKTEPSKPKRDNQ